MDVGFALTVTVPTTGFSVTVKVLDAEPLSAVTITVPDVVPAVRVTDV